jgi:excisionase family DNA binding protein
MGHLASCLGLPHTLTLRRNAKFEPVRDYSTASDAVMTHPLKIRYSEHRASNSRWQRQASNLQRHPAATIGCVPLRAHRVPAHDMIAPLPGVSPLQKMSDLTSHVHVQAVTTDVHRADQLLTVADVAGRIGAHEQTVRGWIKNGELKAARFGTRIGYRIKRSDYEDFLHRRTLTGAITAHLLRGASTAPDA